MKYVFDFDDVIFDAYAFKNKIADSLSKYGISREDFLADYAQVRGPDYHSSKHIADIFRARNMVASKYEINNITDDIFIGIDKLLNQEVLSFILEHAKDVSVLSVGNTDFQMRKIVETGIKDIVFEVAIVPFSKKEWVIAFAEKYPEEMVYFIDDNRKHIEHKEFKDLPNLKTILFTHESDLKELV